MHLPEAFAAAIEAAVSRIPGRDLTRAADTLSARYREPGSASPAGTGTGAAAAGRGPGAGGIASASAGAAISSLTNAGLDRPLTDAERAAYLVVRAPATFAAVTAALAELRDRRPELTVRRVLDLGAGPGVASWAALDVFDEAKELRLVERDRGFAGLGREIIAAAAPGVAAIAWKQADLREWIRGDATEPTDQAHPAGYDLVLMSYALGELMADIRARVLDAAWRATSAAGALVIVEPGTPRHFQGVIDARTWLLAQGATIVAPCPHRAPCPMAAAGDWCHFSARVPRTREHRRLKGGSLSYEDEKFSYLIASRSVIPASSLSRIVRHPLIEKGRITLTRCTTDGAIVTTPIGRNDREAFRRARKARWGEVY